MSKYQKEHFRQCRYNPLDEEPLLRHPELRTLLPDDNQWNERRLRYIVAMYDPKSPLIREFASLEVRKQKAAELAGFDLLQDEKIVAKMWDFKDRITDVVVEAYLKDFVQTRMWAMITSFEQTWWEFNARMLKRIEADDDREEMMAVEKKEKIRKEMEALHAVLENYYDQFFHGDAQLKEQAQKRLTAESIALSHKHV